MSSKPGEYTSTINLRPMFAFIKNILSVCSKRNKSDKARLKEKIIQSFTDFKNRRIYKNLTLKIIDKTPQDQLLQTIIDNLEEKVRFTNDHSKECETVNSFSEEQQIIYMIWYLETELNNDGFSHYYNSKGGQDCKLLPKALTQVGALKFAELMRKANLIYDHQLETIKKQRDLGVPDFTDPENEHPLVDLDTEFYHLYETEDLATLQAQYIRKHKHKFVDAYAIPD